MSETMERHRGRLASAVVLVTACLITACDGDVIIDDFGPPSGYARVEGRLLRADGTPGPEGMEVALTRCGLPIGGLAGRSETVADGDFSVVGELPPVDLFPAEADSLLVECELIAGRGFAESGVLDVYFFRRSREPTALHVDLHEGSP